MSVAVMLISIVNSHMVNSRHAFEVCDVRELSCDYMGN